MRIFLIWLSQAVAASSLSITSPVDIVTDRPATLVCRVYRPRGDRNWVLWNYKNHTEDFSSRIYSSRVCNVSIPVSPSSPSGLSGGCQHVNGEEAYTLTIGKVSKYHGYGRWMCRFGRQDASVTLDIQVRSLPGLSIAAPSGDAMSGRPFTIQCALTRVLGNVEPLRLHYLYYSVYSFRECTPSIPVSPSSPAGLLSGGCQRVNGEEVYTVTIQNVTEDMGTHTFYFSYDNKNVEIRLNVKVPVSQVSAINLPDTVLAGDIITFTCVTSASKPKPCVRAYIRSSGSVREIGTECPDTCTQASGWLQTTTRTLTFTAIAEENGAELYCNASNSVTDPPVRSQIYTLNVHYAPVITCNKSHVDVFVGQINTIYCEVAANPDPQIVWRKENRPIGKPVSSAKDPNLHDVTISTLEFQATEKTASGIYLIEASNSVGSSTSEIEIKVIELDAGLSKAGMFAVGFVAGIAVISVLAVSVACCLRGKVTFSFKKEQAAPDNQQPGQAMRNIEDTAGSDAPPTGVYEDLDTTSNAGLHYETLAGNSSSVGRPHENRIYENATVI